MAPAVSHVDDPTDLRALCADRELQSNEIFSGNAYYGIDQVLKRYAGLPRDYALKGTWPHGLVYNDHHVWAGELSTPLPVAFCYPEYRAPAYERHGQKRVVLAASPFLYALDQVEPYAGDRAGTLFFPAHSTHHITAEMNYEALADQLDQLDEAYKPVTVCIYWKDYLMGRHEIFAQRGFPVVSAGHMYDEHFLYRLARLLTRFRYAAGNSLGSHLFYAVKAGCRYFHVDGSAYRLLGRDAETAERDMSTSDAGIEHMARRTFMASTPRPWAEQVALADYFLGAAHKKTPGGLRADLLWAEWADKMLLTRPPRTRLLHYVPCFWRRTALPRLYAVLRRLGQVVRS